MSDEENHADDNADHDQTNEANEADEAEPDSPSPPPPPPSAPGGRERVVMGPDGAMVVSEPVDERNFFQRIPLRLRIIGGVVLVLGIIGFVASMGETRAEDLQPGDCFKQPDGDEIRSVEDQDCDGVHEAEILTTVEVAAGTAWPGSPTAFDAHVAVEAACFDGLQSVTLNEQNLPADVVLGYFFAARRDWNDGDREVLCYASSESGLPGPVLAG